MKAKKIIDYLESHPLISRNALEDICEIPQSTLNSARLKERGLPDKHIEKLAKVLKNYGLKG